MEFFRKNIKALILAAMGALLLVGVVDIFALRFSRGDLYPRYSSLRPDPFGCKALFETLSETGVDVGRRYDPVSRISESERIALIRTGIRSFDDYVDSKGVRDFVLDGGEFIGFFSPDARAPVEKKKRKCLSLKNSRSKSESDEKSESDDKARKRQTPEDGTDKEVEEKRASRKSRIDFMKSIGCSLRAADGVEDDALSRRKSVLTPKHAKKKIKPFQNFSRNFLTFDEESKWEVFMVCDGKPALATRRFGKGRVTLCVSSFPISNEGLAKSRNAELISHIIPVGRKVLFDEHFLGLHEARNIAWLFKKHKLHLLVANIILAALLFVWSNMVSMSNISTASSKSYYDSETVESRLSSGDALRNLINRSLKSDELIRSCVSEWMRTAKTRGVSDEDVAEISDILRKHEKSNPMLVYGMISDVLNKNRS